jgi:ribosomal protein S18 acetylase RimI-like enzyme
MIDIRIADRLTPGEIEQLADLLTAVVSDGASIGFLGPPAKVEAAAYWQRVLEPGVDLLLAKAAGVIVGTVQLQAASSANGRHRAEIAKLMVSPRHRRQGIGRRLMEAAESAALRDGRWLLVLDTREGDPSNDLYRSLGYVEVGRIPRYARSLAGQLDATVYYYKELTPPA